MSSILFSCTFGFAVAAQPTNQPAKGTNVAQGINTSQQTNDATKGPGFMQSSNHPFIHSSATGVPPPSAPAQRGAAELEKLAMPIALHPDPLIAVILPASVYPVEIVQAARFARDTNNLSKVDQQPWDENVKALAKFPDMLARMDADLQWTVQLGQAFVDQPKQLMDTIQSLRAKAKQAGTLQSTPQQVVTVTNEVVMQTNLTQVLTLTNQILQIQSSNPEVVYVPTYSPTVYYPPPGYVYDPYAPLLTFGLGVAAGAIIANNCDWHGGGVWVGRGGVAVWGGGYGDVDVDVDRNVNVNQNATRNVNRSTTRTGNTSGTSQQQKWQPNQARMQTSGAASAQNREARGWSAGSSQGAQASGTTGGTRPSQPPVASGGTRPSQQPASGAGAGGQGSGGNRPSGASRPTAPSGGTRPSTPQQPSASRPTPSTPNRSTPTPSQSSPAFSGVNSGGGAHDFSSRGAASRGGGGGARGGGRR